MQETTLESDLTDRPAQDGEDETTQAAPVEPDTPDEPTEALCDAARRAQPEEKRVVRGKGQRVDMLHGPMLGKIILFALPLAASSILQQLFNSADLAVAGRFAGEHAQAAVAGNAPIINLLINLFVGLSSGVNVVIANFIGQRRPDDVRNTVHNAIPLALVSGFFLLALGQVVASPALRLMGTPDDVLPQAVAYLRIYFLGMPFIMVYNFGSAILRAIGDTKRPLICLTSSGVLNVGLNLLFVVGFGMAADGVALATTLSNGVSASLVLGFLLRSKDDWIRLKPRNFRLQKRYLARVARIGIPSGLQSACFSLSNLIIQSSINSFGAVAMAATAVAANFETIVCLALSAFGQAAATFVSQNYGAKNYKRCNRAFYLAFGAGMAITLSVELLFLASSRWIIPIFSNKQDVIDLALRRIFIVLPFYFLQVTFDTPGNALRGINHSILPFLLTLFGTCILRLIWIGTVFRIWPTYDCLIAIYPISWGVTGLASVLSYFIVRRRAFRERKKPARRTA